MLAWIAASAIVCVICATLGFGSFFSMTPQGQGLLLLVLAIAATVLLGAFEAYEGQGRTPERTEDA